MDRASALRRNWIRKNPACRQGAPLRSRQLSARIISFFRELPHRQRRRDFNSPITRLRFSSTRRTQKHRIMPRFRPRISLLSAILLTTIVALAIGIAQIWREVGPLRAEVRRLRDEVGALSVADPTKPCAIRVRTTDEFTWKWRLWIPEGRSYVLKHASDKIPKQGLAQSTGSITLDEPGETWIEYRIAPDPTAGIWMDRIRTPHTTVGSSSQDWLKWKRKLSTEEGISYTTTSSEPGKVIILARERVSQTAAVSSNIEDPSAGFMIWLEPTN